MSRKYTQEHVDFIAANIQGTKFKDLTAMVSMTAARDLHNGITVTPEFIENGKATRFQKGQAPPNKGVKGIHLSPATEFKKGNIPANHRPVGSERITADGYTEVKIAEPNKWKMKHVITWETANGLIPKGHVVIFADGNRGNIEINNLLLVTRGQLAVMNRTKGGNKMPKYSDEELLVMLKDPQYTSNRQIARALGKKNADGTLNTRLNELRDKNGIPRSRKQSAAVPPKAARNPAAPKIQEIDSTYKVPVPPPDTELLKFDDVKPGEKLLRNGKPIDVIDREKNRITIKDRFGYTDKVTRKYFDANPGKFVRPPESSESGVDEAPKVTVDNIKVNGQPIKSLPDSVKEKIVEKLKEDACPEPIKKPTVPCVHFTQDCKLPELDNCEECPDYQNELAKEAVIEIPDTVENANLEASIESVPTDAGPLHIDPFEDVEYTDSEWVGVEREISDTVLTRREYLDKIDQLLDLMIIDCTDKDMAFKVAGVATKILENGIADEIAVLMEVV